MKIQVNADNWKEYYDKYSKEGSVYLRAMLSVAMGRNPVEAVQDARIYAAIIIGRYLEYSRLYPEGVKRHEEDLAARVVRKAQEVKRRREEEENPILPRRPRLPRWQPTKKDSGRN